MDGLRVSRLQSANSTPNEADRLPTVWAELRTVVFETRDALSLEGWNLFFTRARLSAVGPKRLPIAVGSTMRRVFASAWSAEYRPWLEEVFREVGPFRIALCGGVEQVGL